MKKIITLASLLVGAAMLLPAVASASSHREAPSIAYDPAADNTDVYAWVTPGTHDKVYIIANYIPLEEPAGGPNFHTFSDDVRYVIHVARGGSSLADAVTYYIEFKTSSINYVDPANLGAPLGGGKEFFAQLSGQTQTMTVSKAVSGRRPTVIARDVPVAPVNIGPRTSEIAYGAPYTDAFAAGFIHDMGAEGRVWAGPRDDGFYVDLGGVFDLANLRAKGTAQDGVAGYNVHSIALEIPTAQLVPNGSTGANATLGIWAAAERRKLALRLFNGRGDDLGPWVQVSRLGLPLINEVMIGLQDKDRFNASHPANDATNFGAYFLNPVIVRDAEAVGIYQALNVDPTPLKSNRMDILSAINLGNAQITTVGDVLRLDTSTDSAFPNGRAIPGGSSANREQADVTDVLMSLVLGGSPAAGLGDGVDYNDKDFLREFPFLPLPHEGYSQGHGKPTP